MNKIKWISKMTSRLPLVFSRFLKLRFFKSIFSLKLSLRLKHKIKSIKSSKRYCKATLNVFKKIDDEKNVIYM